MAKVRVIIDVEVETKDLMHRDVGLIANSIRNVVNGVDGEAPEWYTVFCKTAKYKPVGAKLWSVERIAGEHGADDEIKNKDE